MTNEAAAKTPPTLDPDPLRGQSLTMRVSEWPSGQLNLALTDKTGRIVATVQSGPAVHMTEAREWAQALVFRFNSYDMLVEQLARATFEVDQPTPAKDRIDAIADDLQAKIEETKQVLGQARQDYLNEASYRELVAEHRDQLEQRLAEALTTIDRLQDA